jgi:nitroreductase
MFNAHEPEVSMDVKQAIASRRSVKKFADRPVARERIEPLIEAAVLAPNHRMTQPWRFYILGPVARRAYGAVLGGRKAHKLEDAEAARLVVEKVAGEHEGLALMIAVSMKLNEDPEIREEDYAATMMAAQNLMLCAAADGLGTHLKSGAIMQDPAARAAVGVPADERIVVVIHGGEIAESPPARPRSPAADITVWTD